MDTPSVANFGFIIGGCRELHSPPVTPSGISVPPHSSFLPAGGYEPVKTPEASKAGAYGI